MFLFHDFPWFYRNEKLINTISISILVLFIGLIVWDVNKEKKKDIVIEFSSGALQR
jgi:FtsH-binding integral membrane protein